MFKWAKSLLRLLRKDTKRPYGCALCYDSGAVRLTLRNKHFIEGDYYRKCPNGCEMTNWGKQRLTN